MDDYRSTLPIARTPPPLPPPPDYCDEDEVKTIAAAMKTNGMLELGFNYVNLGEQEDEVTPPDSRLARGPPPPATPRSR